MPYTCCVPGCKSNYLTAIRTEGYISVYHFPENEEERNRWISAVPRSNLAVVVQPRIFSAIPLFLVQIKRDLSYKAYHLGSLCTITTLSRNNLYKYCPTFEEIMRFLKNSSIDHKKKILLGHHEVMGPRTVGSIKYKPEMITSAFEYYATFRTLYSKIAQDFQLPCIRTLQRITSKFGKHDEIKFLNTVMFSPNWRINRVVVFLCCMKCT